MKKNLTKIVVAILAVSLTISACGGLTLSEPTATPLPFTPTPQVKVKISVSATQGGIVALPDGASVGIPAGALQSDTDVTLQSVVDGPKSSSPDATATVGKVYKIDLGSNPLQKPVTLEVPFDPETLAQRYTTQSIIPCYL